MGSGTYSASDWLNTGARSRGKAPRVRCWPLICTYRPAQMLTIHLHLLSRANFDHSSDLLPRANFDHSSASPKPTTSKAVLLVPRMSSWRWDGYIYLFLPLSWEYEIYLLFEILQALQLKLHSWARISLLSCQTKAFSSIITRMLTSCKAEMSRRFQILKCQ
jgi:hypothetical protein